MSQYLQIFSQADISYLSTDHGFDCDHKQLSIRKRERENTERASWLLVGQRERRAVIGWYLHVCWGIRMIEEHGKCSRIAVTHTHKHKHIHTHTRTHTHTHTVSWQDPGCAVGRQAKAAFDWWELLSAPSLSRSLPQSLPSSLLPSSSSSPLPWLLSISFYPLTITLTSALSLFPFYLHFLNRHPSFHTRPREAGAFFFFFYNLLDDNGKRHTTYCIIPASRYYTWQQWAHISVQNIQYDWLYWDKYSSKTQNESSVVWCFTRRGPLFFSSNTSIV